MDGFDDEVSPRDEVSPAEAARERRRDRAADAQARAGMRTGLAKQFKQVLDTQTKRAREAEGPSIGRDTARGGEAAKGTRRRKG